MPVEQKTLVLTAQPEDKPTRDALYNLLKSCINLPDGLVWIRVELGVKHATSVECKYLVKPKEIGIPPLAREIMDQYLDSEKQ